VFITKIFLSGHKPYEKNRSVKLNFAIYKSKLNCIFTKWKTSVNFHFISPSVAIAMISPTCIVNYKTGIDWMIGFVDTIFTQLGTTSGTALSLFTHFTVLRCTRTRVLSFH
jgi:hypothetical protein